MRCLSLILACGLAASVSAIGRRILMRGSDQANVLDRETRSDSALYLTPLIEAGKFVEALTRSTVGVLPNLIPAPELKDAVSYSGYITVNKTCNSNLFFWHFPALNGDLKAPLMLWLQGGPGVSSLFGLFVEHGRFEVTKSNDLKFRHTTWNRNYSMLYIDNPVGTGFSFTDKDECYAKTESDVSKDLYEFLRQFYTLFSGYKNIPFFVTGESYGGKYVPAITKRILDNSAESATLGINLQGMAIGNGFSDPKNMLDYGGFLQNVGLVDAYKEYQDFWSATMGAKLAITEFHFDAAFEIFDQMMDGDLSPYPTYFHNITGYDFYLNFLQQSQPEAYTYFSKYLAQASVREALHVGSNPFNDGKETEKHLMLDIMRDVCDDVTQIIDANIPTLYYSGNLDIIVATPFTLNFLSNLRSSRQIEFSNAPKLRYTLGDYIAGYVQVANNLLYASLRLAGHIVPFDQPEVAQDMIHKFVDYSLQYNHRAHLGLKGNVTFL